ncbi:DUF192 domain-containing protein [Granulosicoccus sp. 3-233]|uniref:DUF192 domain-containing protein n=1 Tax=Granulosicoccus sp. 3-233 TaxID=3417969 RepID=UPI003D330A02
MRKTPLRHDHIIAVESARPWIRANSGIWRLTTVLVALVATLCLVFAAHLPARADSAQPRLPSVSLLIDGKAMNAEVAATSQQRYMGLSFRRSMGEDEGMLFVYEGERPLTFTMRNTLIPLSIAFISEDMVINEIHDMNVGPNQLFDSRAPAKFALEVNQGWFERNGIEAGAQIVMQ